MNKRSSKTNGTLCSSPSCVAYRFRFAHAFLGLLLFSLILGCPPQPETNDSGTPVRRAPGADSGIGIHFDAGGAPDSDAGNEMGFDAGPESIEDGGAVNIEDAGGQNSLEDGGASSADAGQIADSGVSATNSGLEERPANLACVAHPRPSLGADVELQLAFSELEFSQPIAMEKAPGDPDYWYMVEKGGRVLRFLDDDSTSAIDLFVDIDDRVNSTDSETGLLGIAFHPNYQTNGEVFLSYTETGTGGNPYRSVISRFTTQNGGLTLDPNSEEVILKVDQPYKNHNGGDIKFGPDGLLYISFGDGGSAGDPINSGQDTNTLLGALLRIDVDTTFPYSLPVDNPFVGTAGRDEIFSWGLRNVWKFSFDSNTGDIWAGDVGQGAREEVDILERGGNYGWKIREGKACYSINPCDIGGLIDPILDYPHSEGKSITGGYVYRGNAIPGLIGAYIYGDYKFGKVWALLYDAQTGEPATELLASPGYNISSFAQDDEGELYVLRYSATSGRIYRLVPAGPQTEDSFPQLLSETGCVVENNPTAFPSGLIPYEINWPFWSDGASKTRLFAIPDGTTISLTEDGDFTLPIGSVLVKEFKLDGKRIETRLFMRHSDGDWGGYTYVWNDAQTEATLLSGASTLELDDQVWSFPSRPQCLGCHSEVVGRSIGLKIPQLNRDYFYAQTNQSANQLHTYAHIGLLDSELPETLGLFPVPEGTASESVKARAYLDVNCATCHQPNGLGQGELDLRFDTLLADMNICEIEPQEGDLSQNGAQLLVPGNPLLSILSLRMHAMDLNRMPETGSNVVDETGTNLVDQWILSIDNCP
jgi:uncharacterized repeat protein (TIGR03806 family)